MLAFMACPYTRRTYLGENQRAPHLPWRPTPSGAGRWLSLGTEQGLSGMWHRGSLELRGLCVSGFRRSPRLWQWAHVGLFSVSGSSRLTLSHIAPDAQKSARARTHIHTHTPFLTYQALRDTHLQTHFSQHTWHSRTVSHNQEQTQGHTVCPRCHGDVGLQARPCIRTGPHVDPRKSARQHMREVPHAYAPGFEADPIPQGCAAKWPTSGSPI